MAEKRAWLRRRVLTCYQKAGQPDAAITHYRAAVKADPDDLDLRLELAEALLANEQEIAGRNELRRILERDPHHQGANAKLAEFHQMRGEWWEAERLYRDVLAADPDNNSAKRGLAELLRRARPRAVQRKATMPYAGHLRSGSQAGPGRRGSAGVHRVRRAGVER